MVQIERDRELLAEKCKGIQEAARDAAPVKVGEQVIIPEFASTHRGKRADVVAVYLKRDFLDKWGWHVTAIPRRKDGAKMVGARSSWRLKL